MTTRRGIGVVLLVAGLALALVAAINLATDDDPDPRSSSTTTSSTTSHTESAEDPAEFLATFSAALRARDVDYLLGRLSPAVIRRYGEEQCRATLTTSRVPPDLAFELVSADRPAPFEWITDGISEELTDVVSIQVDRVAEGDRTSVTVHFPEIDGRLHWLTDCGEPTLR